MIEIVSLAKNDLFIHHECRNKKIICIWSHDTHGLTGHEEIANLHFDLKIIFIAYLVKTMYFLKVCTVYYESRAYYCLTKFC